MAVAEWRFGRGWPPGEIQRRLAALPRLPVTAAAAGGGARCWSRAIIALERPGPALPEGPFARACELVRGYEFSNPRIVRAHFDRDRPLPGRPMLLELRVLGLRFLAPVVVAEVRDRSGAGGTTWGFRYDTLDGHLEAGLEWFLVTKDHASGQVSFRIEATWREGQLPNWWSRLGFRWLAQRYQRAWHRLAHLRLRARLGAVGLPPPPARTRLLEVGAPQAPPELAIEEVTDAGGGET